MPSMIGFKPTDDELIMLMEIKDRLKPLYLSKVTNSDVLKLALNYFYENLSNIKNAEVASTIKKDDGDNSNNDSIEFKNVEYDLNVSEVIKKRGNYDLEEYKKFTNRDRY